MSPHRTPGERDECPDVEPLHRGPRETCPACGARDMWQCEGCERTGVLKPGTVLGRHGREGAPKSVEGGCDNVPDRLQPIQRLTVPIFCGPKERIRLGWFRRCFEPGEHLHQRCNVCNAAWICAVLEPVQAAANIALPEGL